MKNYSILPQTEGELLSAFESEDGQTQIWVIDTMQKLRREARPAEKKLGKILSSLGIFYIPQAPFIFYTDSCRHIYFADYYDPKNGLVFEADGPDHFTENGKRNDAIRDANFLSVGIRTLRFKNSKIEHFEVTKRARSVNRQQMQNAEVEIQSEPETSDYEPSIQGYVPVLYLCFLSIDELTTVEKMVLSFYVQLSLNGGSKTSSVFKRALNISERTFFGAKKKLRSLGYLIGNNVKESLLNPQGEYFNLRTETKLSDMALIVYSYICYKSAKYGWIDKYHSAIARGLHTNRTYIETILTKLKKERLIMVKEKGTQSLLAPTKKPYLPFTRNWR